MTKQTKTIGLATAVLFVLFVASVMNSCSKSNPSNETPGEIIPPDEIPDEISSFWESDYRQKALNGNVKTVKTVESGSTNYDFLEFDSNGNLIKEYVRRTNNTAYFSGTTLMYNEKNQLVKVYYGTNSKIDEEVVDFGYDGSNNHNVYFPTNIYFETDMRLKKGVTSFKWIQTKDQKLYADFACTSSSGNTLLFDGSAPLLDVTHVDVDFKGSYPENVKFKNIKDGKTFSIHVVLGEDGIPVRLSVRENGEETGYCDYTTIAGFLLMTKYVLDTSSPKEYSEYQYNDKGYMTYERARNGNEYRYEYTYDANGNWTKRTGEVKTSSSSSWRSHPTQTREYTYW